MASSSSTNNSINLKPEREWDENENQMATPEKQWHNPQKQNKTRKKGDHILIDKVVENSDLKWLYGLVYINRGATASYL